MVEAAWNRAVSDGHFFGRFQAINTKLRSKALKSGKFNMLSAFIIPTTLKFVVEPEHKVSGEALADIGLFRLLTETIIDMQLEKQAPISVLT